MVSAASNQVRKKMADRSFCSLMYGEISANSNLVQTAPPLFACVVWMVPVAVPSPGSANQNVYAQRRLLVGRFASTYESDARRVYGDNPNA